MTAGGRARQTEPINIFVIEPIALTALNRRPDCNRVHHKLFHHGITSARRHG
jgi:hypothetical protein